jgi:adenylate kinase
VIFFDCPEEVMEARLLKRGETSGRSDDNAETIRKRFKTFVDQSLPVIEHYEEIGKAYKISATASPDQVFVQVEKVIDGLHAAAAAPAKAAGKKAPKKAAAAANGAAAGKKKAAPATEVTANGGGAPAVAYA